MNGRNTAMRCVISVFAICSADKTLAQLPVSANPSVYLPSMADLMTTAIQPRHAKLGLAIREQNFDYAGYEVRELRNAFRRIGRTLPVFEGKDTVELMSTAAGPLDALEKAIKISDKAGAKAAYEQLTLTCNVCHQGVGHGNIVIVPVHASAFANQDFRKPRPGR